MLRRTKNPTKQSKRRAVVAFQVAVAGTMMIGFAALAIDVSAMYGAKGEMQRTADAAALAAAAMLSENSQAEAFQAAKVYAEANPVLGRSLTLTESDVTFGKAVMNDAGGYTFVDSGVPANAVNAVRVTVRHTADSPNQSLPLYFASIFGKDSTEMTTEAIAMMVPRDIAVVADLSASHNDDSELQHVNATQINLFDVWAALPIAKGNAGVGNGLDPPPPGNPNNENDQPGTGPGSPANAGGNPNPGAEPFTDDVPHGPRWGWMTAYGSEIVFDTSQDGEIDGIQGKNLYDPTADAGLYYIPRYANTTDPDVIENLVQAGYDDLEIAALTSAANDGSTSKYRNRVKVMLGLAGWRSKMKDEYGNRVSKYNGGPGDGDFQVDDNELWQELDYPFDSGSWSSYVDYVKGTSAMTREWSPSYPDRFGDSNLQYRYGIKTVVNYALESKPTNSQTPEFADTPAEPMESVKEAVQLLVDTVYNLESEDQLSLEIYDTRGRHKVDLRDRDGNYYEVSDTLDAMQAGHHDVWTNMGAGILRAREELSSDRSRTNARPVMILLTDGYANVASEYGSGGNYYGGPAYARSEAELAAAEGIQIFCVSVGSYSDLSLMDDIAEIGGGEHLNASGVTVEEMGEQLNSIFQLLGGRRPVELIK